jgi:Rod binding domain-containing protein
LARYVLLQEKTFIQEHRMANFSATTFERNPAYGLAASSDKATLMRMKNHGDAAALQLAAKEFSAMFIGQMFSEMQKNVGTSDLINGGMGEEVFRGMLTQEYARQAAYQDGTGLSQMVYHALQSQTTAAPQFSPPPTLEG